MNGSTELMHETARSTPRARRRNTFAILTVLAIAGLLGLPGLSASAAAEDGCLDPPVGMTGWWPGDGSAEDIYGVPPHDGALSGDASYAGGQVGDAFALDGNGDFVSVPHDPALNVGTGDFTIDFWVYFNTTVGEQILVEKYLEGFTSPSHGWTLTKLSDNRLAFGSGPSTTLLVSDPQALSDNNWVHVAARRSAGVGSIFVNGSEIVSGPLAYDADSNSALHFGHRGPPDHRQFDLNGRIDEVELFVGTALSDTDIAAIHNAGSNGKCKDFVPPVVTGQTVPGPGVAGWFNTPPTIVWSAVDPEPSSGLATTPADTIADLEGGAVTYVSDEACDVAGNCSAGSVTIALDVTSPEIAPTTDADANAAGWFNEPVTVSFTCADALSGIDSCTEPITVGEGGNQSVAGTAVDVAGNFNSTVVSGLHVDLTAPSITAEVTPPVGSSGWILVPATVAFSCLDPMSGVASCPEPVVLGDGNDQSAEGTAVDVAGNETLLVISGLDVDSTQPAISAARAPAANEAGWNNEPVTVSFDCHDAGSGILSCSVPVIVGEGADQSATGTAVDTAGHTTSATISEINVDLTAPDVAIVGVQDGDVFDIGTVVAPSCVTADGLSGVATDAEPTVSGGNSDGSGVFTVTCAGATDVAGNVAATVSATYEMHYVRSPEVFTGGNVDAPPFVNTGKAGRVYPVQWELYKGAEDPITDLAAVLSITYQSVACGTLDDGTNELEAETNGQRGLTNNNGTFKFHWDTPTEPGCYQLAIGLVDGSQIAAYFELT